MPLSLNLTAPQLRWRARAQEVAAEMPQYRGRRGSMLYARMPGAAPEGAALDLGPGDVVSFRFPYLDAVPAGDGERNTRPGLIVERDDVTDSVVVAYATTRATRANHGHEIRVNQELDACGLSRPTRFVLTRRIRVSRSDARFEQIRGAHVSGRLPEVLMARLARLRGLLTEHYGDEELRHVHEWIGANGLEDRFRIAATLARLRGAPRAAA